MGRLDYVLTDEDYVAFNQHAYRSSPGLVARVRKQRIAISVTLLLMFPIIGLISGELVGFLLVGVGTAVSFWFLWPWLQKSALEGQLNRPGQRRCTGPVMLTWDDQRIDEDFVSAGGHVAWAGVQAVEESATHVFLVVGDGKAIIVPKRAGAGVAQLAVEARGHVPKHD